MDWAEMIVFILYLAFMLGVGIFFFVKNKTGGEKSYFLGGKKWGLGSRRFRPVRPI